MKIIKIFVLLLFGCSMVSRGQEPGFHALQQTKKLQQSLAAQAAKTQDIKSDFTQEKQMQMMKDKIVTYGKFYFKKKDKVRIAYTRPFSYILVMNGGNIVIQEDGKVHRINTRNSKTMQSVNEILLDCMQGTVFQNESFQVRAFMSGKEYLLSLTPRDAAMKALFSMIQVFIGREDLQVVRLKMVGANGDETLMKFTNVHVNTGLSDALFHIR